MSYVLMTSVNTALVVKNNAYVITDGAGKALQTLRFTSDTQFGSARSKAMAAFTRRVAMGF